MAQLSGKVAVVTGAGRNIGEAIALELARNGASVAIVTLHQESGDRTLSKVQSEGGKGIAMAVDNCRAQEIQLAVSNIIAYLGRIDVLVNNAAVAINRSILELDEESWDWVMNVNLKGVYLWTRYVALEMIRLQAKGSIVNVAASSAHRGTPRKCAYCTSKAGLLGFTRQVAVDLAPFSIRINAVTPTKTGSAVGGLVRDTTSPTQDIPLGRLGDPQDIATAVLFLVSDAANFITGTELIVDGGMLALRGTMD